MTVDNIDSSPVIETLGKHVSIREYIDKPISDSLLDQILEAARRSPTSSNLQTYSFVVVRDQETKYHLAKFAGNQKHIETCSAFVAICADISRLELACEIHGQKLGKSLEGTLVATVDAAIAGMSLSTAAESFGLGTVMIGGMRNKPDEVAKLLNFPPGVFVVYGLCIGWPDWERVKGQKPRLAKDAIIHYEKYDASVAEDQITKYDRDLVEHYKSEGRDTPDHAWTGIIAKRFTEPRRPHLKSTLESLGFSLD